MARSLSRPLTLILNRSPQFLPEITRRHRSTHAPRAQLIEIDLDSSSDGADVEVLGLSRLEDAIHSIMVQRSVPSWIVFRPGTSYWVPPKPRASNIVQLMGKLSNPSLDESLSFSSDCGWPSSSFFLTGNGFPEPLPKEVVTLHDDHNAETSKPEDEE